MARQVYQSQTIYIKPEHVETWAAAKTAAAAAGQPLSEWVAGVIAEAIAKANKRSKTTA